MPQVKGKAEEIVLSPVQKLAALMILLGEEAAGIILKTFDKNERELVCSEMANLPMLDLEKQQTILREFTERAVAANSALEGSEEYTKKVLERAVGMFEAEEIISRVSMSRTSVPAMQQIIDMDPLGVTNLIKEEQPQTIALVVSYLPPAKAALHRDSLAKILYARLFDEVILFLCKEVLRSKSSSSMNFIIIYSSVCFAYSFEDNLHSMP